ncbi:MAG TPA: rhodanese-like domain-containing protein [Armatimonadota bacterium]|nr:rhodanese-like domain-containing protein [Armatimonadota bacterium]
MSYREITPDEAAARHREGGVVIVDVRTLPEWIGGHIPGAVHIVLDDLPARHGELDPEAETLVICQHGIRSAHASLWLSQMGFEAVVNVRQGMSRWRGPVETGLGGTVTRTEAEQ